MGGGIEFAKYKRQMVKAAEDLRYGPEVVKHIKNAKTDREITRIMTAARKSQMAKEMK